MSSTKSTTSVKPSRPHKSRGASRLPLKRINTLLLVCIVLINAYIIAAPLLPHITFWWQSKHSDKKAQLTHLVTSPPAVTAKANGLIIPAMMLDSPTLEAPKSDWSNALKKGIWRWPDSSTPDKGGNTVFLAHRFSYTGPRGAFYYLDKLKAGDEIGVVWNNKTYTYQVVSSREVPPTEVSILDNTSDARITLYTCTPLWHPVNRLVVVAELKAAPKEGIVE